MDVITVGAKQELNFVNGSLCQLYNSLILSGEGKIILSFLHKLFRTMFWKQT